MTEWQRGVTPEALRGRVTQGILVDWSTWGLGVVHQNPDAYIWVFTIYLGPIRYWFGRVGVS